MNDFMNLGHSRSTATASGGREGADLLAEFKRATIAKILRLCPAFADLPSADLDAIAAISVMKFSAKGECLFLEGATAEGFYVLQQGAIKMYRVDTRGHEQIIHVFRPTESFAEEALISESGQVACACAVEASQLLLVQRAGFLALLRRQPELALCLLRSMGEHVSQLVGLLDDLALKDVKTRLANWLLQHSTDPESHTPQRIQLPATKRLLASELGTTSETFSRTLKIFRNRQLISVGRRTVTLLSAFRLREMLLQNLGAFPSPGATSGRNRSSGWRANGISSADAGWLRQKQHAGLQDLCPAS
jgi:CRP/FNR family transcriptional regulator, dissimilatory nitrate respiration regulator